MRPIKIGLSACFFHADPKRPVFKGKTLLYLEESMAHWVMSAGALVYLIPSPPGTPTSSLIDVNALVNELDGLVLQGGSDVSPKSYGETPLKPEWSGDYVRDCYEIALVKEFATQKKPILGICRGLQLLNVCYGGTLYQDIATQNPSAITHRDWEIYDTLFHSIKIESGSGLATLYPGVSRAQVNSVHHQSIKDLAPGFAVEARSVSDGIIEAIRHQSDANIFGVQWHPEFQTPYEQSHGLLTSAPILNDFIKAARKAGTHV